MDRDRPPKQATHKNRKSPSKYVEDKTLSSVDKKLVENLELSETEFRRYKQIQPNKKAEIIHLLTERKRLNEFVKAHLLEEINQQFGQVMQLFFPSEHNLKYALQKVDEIEAVINSHLEDDFLLFNTVVTKKNRLEMLLTTAYAYQALLDKTISNSKNHATKDHVQKHNNLTLIIEELHQQLERSEYFIHNKALLTLKDSELNYFINKLKAIGISGFQAKSNKYQPSFFGIRIFTALYEQISPKSTEPAASDEHADAEKEQKLPSPKRSNR